MYSAVYRRRPSDRRGHCVRPLNVARSLTAISSSRVRTHLGRCRIWQTAEPKSARFRACGEPIMECQDITAQIAEYLAGSLRVEELEGVLTHAAACATCRDKLTETWRQLGRIPPAEFDAVLAGYQDGPGGRPRNTRRLPRCATCHLSGQSCSWICRRRFLSH